MRRNIGWILASGAAFIAAGSTFGQVAGDECTNALTVTAGTAVTFNTDTMTASANPPEDGACPFLDWGASKDVWYRFVAADTGLSTISLCGSSYDTSMVVYTGTCAALTRVGCDDDTCGALYESIIDQFGVTAGTTYYIRIGGWNADSGAGTMLITVEPVSAGCDGATGNCAVVHAEPGCSDPTCCTQVCAVNPLCCDIGWDADCVASAVDLCGVFAYSCTNPNTAVPNDCATNAIVISGDGFRDLTVNGCNTDGPNHAAANCSSGNDVFYYDVWYRGLAPANGVLTLQTCVVNGGPATTFDTKIAVYNMGTNPAAFDYNTLNTAIVGCIDDNCTASAGVYPSFMQVNVLQGNWYLIRVASYDLPGSARLTYDFPEPCLLPTATGTENEVCGANGNGGCNDVAGGAPVQPINLGDKIAGTFWADGGNRDTDWYGLNIASDTQVTVNLKSASFSSLFIFDGTCEALVNLGTGSGSCPNTTTACLRPGNYKIFVATQGFEGLPCGTGTGNNYVLEVSGAPATCPVYLQTTCDAPGPDTATINAANTVSNGLVACAVGGPTGGTTTNSYARVFSAASVGGQINCLNFGVYCARVTATGTFISDVPQAATIGIYKDIDGAAPRYISTSPTDGGDLVSIWQQAIMVPGGVYLGTMNFEEPLCIDDITENLVVVVQFPPTVPANSGYQIRAGGNTAGPTGNTYCRLSCADGAGQFVLTESLGATFTAQWVVALNGDFSGCDAGGIPGDLNGDGVVNAADLAILLGQWGGPGSADLNGDGTVSAADLAILLGSWG